MIEKLACKLGRNDEAPNIELAEALCKSGDEAGVREIVGGLHSADKAVASDCIKVLYETGARNPRLIAAYAPDFIAHLKSKNNRIVWGCMTALAYIAVPAADVIFESLTDITAACEAGSVITADNSISVFAGLCAAKKEYAEVVFPMILRHLKNCGPREVPQHAERAAVCIDAGNAGDFAAVLESRRAELSPSQAARINKLLRRISGLLP